MSHRGAITESSFTAVQERHLVGSTLLSDYWALTKPEVNFLILITTFVGFIWPRQVMGGFHSQGYSTLCWEASELSSAANGPAPRNRWWRCESGFLSEE